MPSTTAPPSVNPLCSEPPTGKAHGREGPIQSHTIKRSRKYSPISRAWQKAVGLSLWGKRIIAAKQKQLFAVVIQTSKQIFKRPYDFTYLSTQT